MKKLIASLLMTVLVVLGAPSVASADDGQHAPAEVIEWLETRPQPYGWPSTNQALNIAKCESGGQVYGNIVYDHVPNSATASGGFQFLHSTWQGRMIDMHPLVQQAAASTAYESPPWTQDVAFVAHWQDFGNQQWVCWGGASSGDRFLGFDNHLVPVPDRDYVGWTPNLPLWTSPTGVILSYGRATDQPLLCDHDGDGIHSLTVVRGRIWFVDTGNNGDRGELVFSYGRPGDIFDCYDHDGDGRDDLVSYRSGTVYIRTAGFSTGIGDVEITP